MHDWIITTDVSTYAQGGPVQDTVHAEYMKIAVHGFADDNGFIEFKDADHKTVYLVSSRRVVSVTRIDREADGS